MNLAIFDLDNTLIGGDSDHAWGGFLADKGLVDGEHYRAENQRFYEQYKNGTLNILQFLEFSLKPLAENPLDNLLQWRKEFIADCIEPLILPKAEALVEQHRQQGHTLLIITATNRFITEPIADRLGIDNLLATEPELKNNRYTGKVAGIPCFQEGKVSNLQNWLTTKHIQAAHRWFYTDSHNDIPLLEQVESPIAVDPDRTLSREAEQRGWQTISLR